MEQLKYFEIQGLFGFRTVKVDLKDDFTILIGENGFGKTVVLTILAHLFQKKFDKLREFDFVSIQLKFSNKTFNINHDDLDEYIFNKQRIPKHRGNSKKAVKIIERELDYLSDEEIKHVTKVIKGTNGRLNSMVFRDGKLENYYEKINLIGVREGIPRLPRHIFIRLLDDVLDTRKRMPSEIKNFSVYLDENFQNVNFLYFTTFRRVVDDLESLRTFGFIQEEVLENVDIFGEDSNLEVSDYAMTSVQSKIEGILSEIRKNALESFNDLNENLLEQYLGLEETKLPYVEIDEERLKIVLSRLGERINQDTVTRVFESLHEDNANQNHILNNYLSHLISSYDKTKSYEIQISEFQKVVNKFLIRKKFEYNSGSLEFKIVDALSKQSLPLSSLSSGEKQIVSIFSSLYLTEDDNVFMFIDEPEISLSIDWQKLLMTEILKAKSLRYMIAVTHSPFIIDSDIAFSHSTKFGYYISEREI